MSELFKQGKEEEDQEAIDQEWFTYLNPELARDEEGEEENLEEEAAEDEKGKTQTVRGLYSFKLGWSAENAEEEAEANQYDLRRDQILRRCYGNELQQRHHQSKSKEQSHYGLTFGEWKKVNSLHALKGTLRKVLSKSEHAKGALLSVKEEGEEEKGGEREREEEEEEEEEEKEKEKDEEGDELDKLTEREIEEEERVKGFYFKRIQISPQTPLSTLQRVATHLKIRNATSLLLEPLLDNIRQVLKVTNRYYDNAPDVLNLEGKEIQNPKTARLKAKKIKTQKKKGKGGTKNSSKSKNKSKTKSKTKSSLRSVSEEEMESSSSMGVSDTDLVDPEMGGLWFAPRGADGRSFSEVADTAREVALKAMVDNFFYRQPELAYTGRYDPITAIWPVGNVAYKNKIAEVDLMFGKKEGDSITPKALEELLRPTLAERQDDKGSARAERASRFMSLPMESKMAEAFQRVARSSARDMDFHILEDLISSIPQNMNLNKVNKSNKNRTLIMTAIAEGKFLDPQADANPLRSIAVILSAARQLGQPLNFNAVDDDGNTALMMLADKCNQLHIEAAQFRSRFSATAIAEREEKARQEARERGSSLFRSSSSSSAPSSSAFPFSYSRPFEKVMSDTEIHLVIARASRLLHACTFALLRPSVLVSHYQKMHIFPWGAFPTPSRVLNPDKVTMKSQSFCPSKGTPPEREIQGADPNQQKDDGVTFASICARNGCWVCLNVLVRYSSEADFTIPETATGNTVLDLAIDRNDPLMIITALKGKVDLLHKNNYKENILHHATRHDWGLEYKRHPGQSDVLAKIRQNWKKPAGIAPIEPPSVLEILWHHIEQYIDALVAFEGNQKLKEKIAGRGEKDKGKEGKRRRRATGSIEEDDEEISDLQRSTTALSLLDPNTAKAILESDLKKQNPKYEGVTQAMIEEVFRWQEEKKREYYSALLDSVSEDAVTPLWIAALKRDKKSVEFLLDKNADPTVNNENSPSGFSLSQALEILPPDTDEDKKQARVEIVELIREQAEQVLTAKRILESELRAYTLTPEEQRALGATATSPTTTTSTTLTLASMSEISTEVTNLEKLLTAIGSSSDRKSTQEFFDRYWNSNSACALSQQALTEKQRKLYLANRRAQASSSEELQKVEDLLTKIETKATSENVCQLLNEELERTQPWLFTMDTTTEYGISYTR